MAANETRDRCPPTIREPEFPRGRDDIASRFASQRFRAPESYSVNVVIITIGRGPPLSTEKSLIFKAFAVRRLVTY